MRRFEGKVALVSGAEGSIGGASIVNLSSVVTGQALSVDGGRTIH